MAPAPPSILVIVKVAKTDQKVASTLPGPIMVIVEQIPDSIMMMHSFLYYNKDHYYLLLNDN